MDFMQIITDDIIKAMKAKEKEKLQALRYLKSMLIENKTAKNPIAEMDVLIKHVKKLKDSLENFPKESPLYTDTLKEISALECYLPKQMTEEEVVALIGDIKSRCNPVNMGAIMKELTPAIKGKFDGKRANDLVKLALA